MTVVFFVCQKMFHLSVPFVLNQVINSVLEETVGFKLIVKLHYSVTLSFGLRCI